MRVKYQTRLKSESSEIPTNSMFKFTTEIHYFHNLTLIHCGDFVSNSMKSVLEFREFYSIIFEATTESEANATS